VRYAREHRAVRWLITTTAVLTIFGMPYMMLAPAVVDKALDPAVVGSALTGAALAARQALVARETGWLMSFNGLGAMIGALVVASLPPTIRRERLVRWTVVTLALALIAFGLSRNLYLSFIISSLAGAMVLTTNSLVNTSIQSQVPHHLRGRVMALFIIAFMGLMPFSAIAFGPLGQAVGPTNAVLGGAVVLLAYGVFLVSRPKMLEPEPEARETGDGCDTPATRA
jgi:MFS family permease